MKTIAQHFASFETAVIPPTASRHQRGDMRMAFFAGATSMLTLMTAAASDNEQIGVTRIAQLEKELRDFTRSLGGTSQ